MRVTGGQLGGRHIEVPGGRAIRPTQDRVREALFSMIAERLAGARFADLFAGSGSVGLDAFSRGAGFVCWVEQNRKVFDVLKRNVDSLCGDGKVSLCRSEAMDFISRGAEKDFDIVYADPPYGNRLENAGNFGRKWCRELLVLMAEKGFVASDGLFIMEQSALEEFPSAEGWRIVKDRIYGDTRIGLFIREECCIDGSSDSVRRLSR